MNSLAYGFLESPDLRTDVWFRFNPCSRTPASWKEELYTAARAIANRTTKPIWVCAGGGLKSEVVCRAFFDQGIHFSVLTMEHEAGTNSPETGYVREWCRARGIYQKIIRIDMQSFLEEEIDSYAERYVAAHPFRYFQIRLMECVEELGGFAVQGTDEHVFYTDKRGAVLEPADMYMLFSTGNIAPLEWCAQQKTDHEPYFFFSSPELSLSYMNMPVVDFALKNPDAIFRHSGNTYTLRRLAFQSIWTDIHARYRFTGLEEVTPLVSASLERLAKTFGPKLSTCRIPVSVALRQLSGE